VIFTKIQKHKFVPTPLKKYSKADQNYKTQVENKDGCPVPTCVAGMLRSLMMRVDLLRVLLFSITSGRMRASSGGGFGCSGDLSKTIHQNKVIF
jgi:hypothetical protein